MSDNTRRFVKISGPAVLVAFTMMVAGPGQGAQAASRTLQQGTHEGAHAAAPAPGSGTPFTAEQLSSMLPATVYFAGRTAPLQLRNAGGTKFASGSTLWISLVDSSGYSSSVQERYQFYLVTEGPLRFGDVTLRPGAYGGGFVGDRFVLMDLGDHTIGEGATQNDTALPRPRPLQLFGVQPNAVKLYLGRRWVMLRSPE